MVRGAFPYRDLNWWGVGLGWEWEFPNKSIFLAPSLILIQGTVAESSDRPNASRAPLVVNPFNITIVVIIVITIIIIIDLQRFLWDERKVCVAKIFHDDEKSQCGVWLISFGCKTNIPSLPHK